MEDKVIEQGNLGTIGKYEIDFKGGQLVLSASAGADGISSNVSISVSGKAVLDLIAKKIGGPIPAEIATFLEASLGLV